MIKLTHGRITISAINKPRQLIFLGKGIHMKLHKKITHNIQHNIHTYCERIIILQEWQILWRI